MRGPPWLLPVALLTLLLASSPALARRKRQGAGNGEAYPEPTIQHYDDDNDDDEAATQTNAALATTTTTRQTERRLQTQKKRLGHKVHVVHASLYSQGRSRVISRWRPISLAKSARAHVGLAEKLRINSQTHVATLYVRGQTSDEASKPPTDAASNAACSPSDAPNPASDHDHDDNTYPHNAATSTA
ncbi:hypothetical protein B566_EDAN017024 [Ephemera danica]|nr:hypothetical protein B566_EDAN017024 [Ephemera danica]